MANKIFKFSLIIGATMLMYACGQKTKNIVTTEKNIVTAEKEIIAYYYNSGGIWEVFLQLLQKYPESMEYDFPVLLDSIGHFSFVESEDSNMRIYLWESLGILRCADYWLQWKDKKGKVHSAINSLDNLTANGKFSEEDGMACAYIDAIYTVNSEDKTYYLIPTWSSYHEYGSCAIYACTINEDGLLASTKLFKTNTSILSSIETDYNSYAPLGAEIHFDSKTNTLYFPLVKNHIYKKYKKHIYNGTYLLYQWDGKYFTYEGTGYWLNPGLLNYWQNVVEFDTEKFHIRIDEIRYKKYRYASWSKGKTIADKPDLVIENGIKKCWCESGIEDCDCNITYNNGDNAILGEIYIFISGKYEYIYQTGWDKESSIDKLIVRKKNNSKEVVLQENVIEKAKYR